MRVSLVIAAHNEEENIPRLLNKLIPVLVKYPETSDYEIIIIDDNSNDRTPEIVDSAASGNPRIKVIHLREQAGFGTAMKTGLSVCSGEILIPLKSDLSDHPDDIIKLVRKIEEGNDIAYGSREVTWSSVYPHSFKKIIANRLFNNVVRFLTGIPHRDITNSFKAYRREVIESIGVDSFESRGFDLTLELPLKAYIEGFQSADVQLPWNYPDLTEEKFKPAHNATLYGKRLLKIFYGGILVAVKDLFRSVWKGSWIGIVLGLLLGILILFTLFSFFGVSELIILLSHLSLGWFLVSCLAIICSFLLRTWRWGVILRSSGFPQPPGILFKCISFSSLLNYLLPFRIGDIARAVALKTTQNAPLGMTLSTIVVERIYDLTILSLLLLLSGFLISVSYDFTLLIISTVGLAILLIIILLFIYRFESLIVRLFRRNTASIQESISILKQGLREMVQHKPSVVFCLLLSIPIWITEIASIYFVALAIGEPIEFLSATVAGIAAFIAQSLPLTPAGIGIHEASITAILILFDVPAQIGLSIALVDHAARALVIYVFGAISTIHIAFASRGYFKRMKLQG